MQFKTLALFALSATAVFADAGFQVGRRQFPVSAPPSIESVLLTAFPTSILPLLTEPAAYASYTRSFASALAAGSPPAWYSSLPPNVKSYILGQASMPMATMSMTTSGPVSSYSSGSVISYSSSGSVASATSSTSSTASSGSTASTASSASGTASAQSSTSSAAAPAATDAIAMGVAGAVGILGLALAL